MTHLNADAIKSILELSSAAQPTNTFIPTIVMPQGCTLVDLEKFMDAPARKRGVFRTVRIDDFCIYVDHEKTNDTAIFVAPDGKKTVAVIDYGNHSFPQWGDHRATLTLKETPEFEALQALCKRELSQRDIIEWIEDWSATITPHINGSEITPLAAITALRKVKIDQKASATVTDQNFQAARSTMEMIEASSADGPLPNGLDLTCNIYESTALRTIRTRLAMKTGGDKPYFTLRIIAIEIHMRDIANEIHGRIKSKFHETRVFIGEI